MKIKVAIFFFLLSFFFLHKKEKSFFNAHQEISNNTQAVVNDNLSFNNSNYCTLEPFDASNFKTDEKDKLQFDEDEDYNNLNIFQFVNSGFNIINTSFLSFNSKSNILLQTQKCFPKIYLLFKVFRI